MFYFDRISKLEKRIQELEIKLDILTSMDEISSNFRCFPRRVNTNEILRSLLIDLGYKTEYTPKSEGSFSLKKS